MERIALLKSLRKEKEAAGKLSEISDTGILEKIILDTFNCKHEYGVIESSDSFWCRCLDCGDYLGTNGLKHVFSIHNSATDFEVRYEYLKLLQQMSVADSFMTLKRKYSLREERK